jgi:hypothetical protein
MSEETDAPQGGAEAEANAEAPTQVETPSDATAEQPTSADEAGLADDAGEAAEVPEKRVPWFQKRIDEVTRQKYEEQRRADYLQGQIDALTRGAPAQPEGPPKEDQFESYEDYEQARIDFAVEQRLKQARVEEQRTTVLRTYEERAAKLRETAPDFDSVVNDPTLKITPLMAEVIRESDCGPQVAYHLGTNRSEAERIASLPPHRQAAELGRLEARLTIQPKPAPALKPIPPAPPQTVTGVSAGLGKTHAEMSYAEFCAAREAEEKSNN